MALYSGDPHALLGEVVLDGMPLTIRSSEDGKMGFVANISTGTVTVVDLVAREVVGTLEVDGQRDPEKKFHMGAHGMAVVA